MELLGLVTLWLHVTAATIWVGGNFMIAMVIVPYFKRTVPPVERIKIMTQIGRGFEPIGWTCVVVLIFSGLINIFTAGVLASPDLIGPFHADAWHQNSSCPYLDYLDRNPRFYHGTAASTGGRRAGTRDRGTS